MITIGVSAIKSMPLASRLSIVAVASTVVLMLGLLYRTESNAAQVSRETRRIAASGRGLNGYTDSIAQLGTTNRLVASILASLGEVNGDLAGIDGSTRRIAGKSGSIQRSTALIDGSTTSINTSEHSIDDSVERISAEVGGLNNSLTGVNDNAAHILAASLSIQRGVALISSNLARTRSVTDQILADAKDINARVQLTRHEAACIDNGLNGGQTC